MVFLHAFVVPSILAPFCKWREKLLKKSHWILGYFFGGGWLSFPFRKHSKFTLTLKCVLSWVQLLTFRENLDLISFSWVLKSCDSFIFCFLDCSLATFVEKLKGGIFSRKNECEMDWDCCLRGNDWFLASRPGPQDRALWLHSTLLVDWTGNIWTLKWNLSHGLMEPTLAIPFMGLLLWRPSLWAWENVARFHLWCQGCVCYCCCRSVAKSCLTPFDPVDCSTPGFPVLRYLPEFALTRIHWVSDTI